MKNYDELIERLEKEFRITEIGLIGDSLNAIKELIEQRDLAMADARYFEKQRDEVTKQRDELVDILVFSRRTLNYYDCNTEEWSVAEERCLRRESIRMIDAALAKIKESK